MNNLKMNYEAMENIERLVKNNKIVLFKGEREIGKDILATRLLEEQGYVVHQIHPEEDDLYAFMKHPIEKKAFVISGENLDSELVDDLKANKVKAIIWVYGEAEEDYGIPEIEVFLNGK